MYETFLQRAHEVTASEVTRLKALMEELAGQLGPAQADLRQVARTLDELAVRTQATGGVVGRQREQLQRRHAQLSGEIAALQQAEREIEQLVRQIEMSSAALGGDGGGADPWRAALMAQVIHGREEERVRLAREVHDGPAQVMAHVLMGLEHALTLSQQDNRMRLESHLRELRDTSRLGLHEVRRFIEDLRPPAIEQHGLAGALRELGDRFAAAGTLAVHYEEVPIPRLTPEQELVIYRIAQEALNNAAKHARGASVNLQWGAYATTVYLQVRDDGPGFDPRTVAARSKGAHWGLRSIHERAELIGARVTIGSAPGKGTSVVLSLAVGRPSRG